MSSFYHRDAPDRMAEFKAIVTASFDDIGSHVALESVPRGPLRPNLPVPPAPPSSTDKRTRRSPISFLRKVKSHASSILCPHPKLDPPPPHSFVPSLPVPRRAPTPIPFANSLPRNCLNRASGKNLQAPDVLDSEPKSSFFDDDDKDENVNKRVSPPTRRISSAPARSNSRRLSSAFAAAPALFGLSSHAVSTPYLAAEKNDVVKPEFKSGLAHSSKTSLKLKLRTKFSLPKMSSSRSHHSSPSTDPSPVTPSYHPHPYSTVFADLDDTRQCRASPEGRSITPEEDPFRRDEMSHTFASNHRLLGPSPRCSFLDGDCETDKEYLSFPMPPSRWSSDSESPPSSLSHTSVTGGRPGPSSTAHAQSPSKSPFSLTFPLPPAQKGVPLSGVTVRVANSPPTSPPPSSPLPHAPPANTTITSRPRLSAGQPTDIARRGSRRDSEKLMAKSRPTQAAQPQRRRSYLQMDKDKPPAELTLQAPEGRSDATLRTQRKTPARRRDRPVTPYPLLHARQIRQDLTGRLEASKAVTGFIQPGQNSTFDLSIDVVPDSEAEPDRDFDSDKARKKMSVSSATSARTAVSNTSTTSESTTTSFASVVTALTAATTASPSTSPNMSADKPRHVSQVLVTDEEGRIVSAATYNIPSSWQTSPSPIDVDAQFPGIYVGQGGTTRGTPSDSFLVRGEHVIISASGWAEFRGYCNDCHDVSVCLAGSSYSNSVADVLVVEIQRAGKTRGVELRVVARAPGLHSNADLPGRIPGSYPVSSDPSLPAIPCAPLIDMPQSARSQWKRGALGLDGVPPLREDEDQTRTVLVFTATLPATLRDLAKHAGEMSLRDGVSTP